MRNILTVLMFMVLPAAAWSQRVGWDVDAYGFFDNSEGDDTYRNTVTFSGLRLRPTATLGTNDGRHRLTAGWDALLEPGTQDGFTDGTPVAYYTYEERTKGSRHAYLFAFGAFPRTMMTRMPDYLIADSFCYFRPNVTGMFFRYNRRKKLNVEAFIDWTAKRTETQREQFMAGVNARWQPSWFQAGVEGYYYHYALETHGISLGHHIHDNAVMHAYAGVAKKKVWFLDSLDFKAGVLLNADRDRGEQMDWYSPAGFIADLHLRWRQLSLHETFYAGGSQQHYRQNGWGEYYWGDTYVQAKRWSRTDVDWTFVKTPFASLTAGLTFNFTPAGFCWHQMVTTRVHLGSHNMKKNKHKAADPN